MELLLEIFEDTIDLFLKKGRINKSRNFCGKVMLPQGHDATDLPVPQLH